MNLSLKFRKDPCFRWGDIQLLVTMYIWYYTLNYSQFFTKNFDFFGTLSWKCFYIFLVRYLTLKERKRIRAFLWKNEPRRMSDLHMIWWHSANRDVFPGRFPAIWSLIATHSMFTKIAITLRESFKIFLTQSTEDLVQFYPIKKFLTQQFPNIKKPWKEVGMITPSVLTPLVKIRKQKYNKEHYIFQPTIFPECSKRHRQTISKVTWQAFFCKSSP